MAQESPLSATGALTEAQYERLAAPHTPDGLSGHPDNPAPVFTQSNQICVLAGLAGSLRGFPWASGPTVTTYVTDLTGAARTDLVVLRLWRDQGYKVETAVRKGTPGAGAPAPVTLTGPNDWYEIPLAEVDVANGAFGQVRRRAWYVGEDGQLLCEAGALPPHAPGRRVRQVDTGRTYESNGSAWVVLLDDSGSVALPYAAGWANGFNRLRRRNGWVWLALSPQRTGTKLSAGAVSTVGNLPVGFRPNLDFEHVGVAISTSFPIITTVRASGAVQVTVYGGLNQGSYLNLGSMTFPAA